MIFEFTKIDEDDFFSNIVKTYLKDGTESCWLWKGHTNTFGYGTFSNSSNTALAHRFSVQLIGKTIPEKWVVNHKCETRNCVNPKHLNIVTQKMNVNLRGKEQSLDDEDESYEKAKPLSNFQMCLRQLENNFLQVGVNVFGGYSKGLEKRNIAKMIKIKLTRHPHDFDEELLGEEKIDGYKRKYFWYFDEILNDYDVKFQSIIDHYEIN